MKRVDTILKEVLEKINPSKEEFTIIEISLGKFLGDIKKEIRKSKLNIDIFVGGSYAKNTLIRKNRYDIDIFLRFDQKHKKNLDGLSEKIMKKFENVLKVHGSRDYFRIGINPKVFFEIVPVLKVEKSENADNITDLSYMHVRYINKKIKSKKIFDEIRIAKAFCYANNCYGAESYINGFSGYGLELLIYHYGSFLQFIKKIVKSKKEEKIIIDIEKLHKNRQRILIDLNASKLHSPIILIDPTYKNRNALAALSKETFDKFKESCKKFLKSPSINSFKNQKIDFEHSKKFAEKKNYDFVLLKIKTSKAEGDVAGSKLIKFYRHLEKEISKFFEIKEGEFEYNEKKSAEVFFSGKSKKEILTKGPFIKDEKNVRNFKKKHKKTFVRKNHIYTKEKIDFSLKKFIEDWEKENKVKMKDMTIKRLEITSPSS